MGFDPDQFIAQNQDEGPTPSPVPAPTPPPTTDQSNPSTFDPDEFIAQNQTTPSYDDFDPDEFIKKHNEEKYGSTGNELGALAEGYAQGFAGPVATAAEIGLSKLGVPNMSAEDIAGRESAYPKVHAAGEIAGFGTGLFTGASEAGVVGKVAAKLTPEAETVLGKIGANALNSAIQSGLFQSGNEITKGLLGQGDPEHPVGAALANVGAASLFGAGTGAILGGAGQAVSGGAKYLQSKNFGKNANEFLTGFGLASISTPQDIEKYLASDASKISRAGLQTYKSIHSKAAEALGGSALAEALPFGNDTWQDRVLKGAAGAVFGRYMLPKAVSAVSSVMGPVTFKILASGAPERAEQSINYALKAMQGQNKIGQGINKLFDYGTSKAVDYENPAQNIEWLKDYISKGGLDTQVESKKDEDPENYATGGQVNDHENASGGLASHLPEQNILLNAAKARIGNFLKSSQPQPLNNKKAFDKEHRDPNKERQYERVLKLANSPLTVLNHVKDGSLLPHHVEAIKGMFPELYKQLSKKMMEKIVDRVHKKDPPPYKMRQSMSLFLGHDLDGSLSPSSIQAAQAVFLNQHAQKSSESKEISLSKSGNQTMTAEQSRTRDLNK